MTIKQIFLTILLISFSKLVISQHTIKIRKSEPIEGLYYNSIKGSKLPSYFYFNKQGKVYYTFSKKLKNKRALVKLTLCSMDSTCSDYPHSNYTYSDGHIRFTTLENVNNNYFIIYDGQLANNKQQLSIRKEETNQLINVAQYNLVTPKK